MPEMLDVIGGEIISSDWGNDIRDRTIQRYANVAERSADHPTPGDGDLSYLVDTDLVYVYYGGVWNIVGPLADNAVTTAKIANGAVTGAKLAGNIMDSLELVGVAVSEGPDTIPVSPTVLASVSVNLTIPSSWVTWACQVSGHTVISQTGDSSSTPTANLVFLPVISGTSNEFHASKVSRHAFGGDFGLTGADLTVPFNAYRSGMNVTGVRTMQLERSRGGLDNVYTMSNTVMIARAHRLT